MADTFPGVYRRCGCLDPATKRRYDRRCPRRSDPRHGCWYFAVTLPATRDARSRRLRRGGYLTAQEAARERQDMLSLSVEQASGYGWSVAAWLDAWLARQLPYLRATTAASYGQHIRDYLTPALGRIRLAELGLPAVQAMFWDLAAVERRNGPLCPNSLQRVRATLRSALSDACRAGLIGENPASMVRIPGWSRTRPVVWTAAREAAWRDEGSLPRVASWDLPHIRRFLEVARDDGLAPLWWLVTLCGLRRGEVAGLRWRHLDVPGRLIHIQEQVIYLGARRVDGPPKSTCGIRSLALDEILLAMLAAHRQRQHRRHGEWAVAAGRPMFTLDCARPVRPDWLTRRFARLIADMDLPPIRLHDLRRATATLGVASGVPLRVMQYILGHADVATTADVYTTVPGQAGRDAMAAIASMADMATAERSRGGFGSIIPR